MNMTHVALVVLVLISVAISIWARARWVRLMLATVFLVIQVLVLAVSFDVHARQAMVAEIKAGRSQDPSHTARMVTEAQLQDRLSAGLVSLGLFLLAVVASQSNRDDKHLLGRTPGTSQGE